jgi:hypothetical protein
MPSEKARQYLTKFRPQLEQLEGRCVPTATVAPHSAPAIPSPTAAHGHVAAPNTGIPTKISQVLAIARNEAKALLNSVHHLQLALAHTPAGSFSYNLLSQDLRVTQAELASMNKLIKSLVGTKMSPGNAYVKVFAKEVLFAETNSRLQNLQIEEAFAGTIAPFRYST